MVLGALVLFLTLGSQVIEGDSGIDLAWIGHLSSEEGGDVRAAVVGSFFAVALWWRGGRLGGSSAPTDDLGFSIRLGILIMAVGAVVDINNPADLDIYPMMFLFFGAGITGLSIGNMLPASRQAAEEGTWPKVIAGLVSAVVVAGLIFSLLQENILSLVSTPVLFVLGGLAKAVFYVVILPLAYVVGFIGLALVSLLQRLGSGESVDVEAIGDLGQMTLEGQQREGGPPEYLVFIQWALVALVVLAVLLVLARAFRRRSRFRRIYVEGARESVREDADPAYDLARLLLNLVPQRFRRGRRRERFALPEDESGIIEVFRVYFGLLTLAEEKGHPRPAAQTPQEFQRTLESLFPAELVRSVTAAFVRTCYGRHPAPPHQIEEMRNSLEQLSAEARS